MFKPYKILFSLILIVLLASGLTFAIKDFDVNIKAIKDSIFQNESAVFDIVIKNNMDSVQTFIVYSDDVSWDLSTAPVADMYKKIYPLEEGSIRINIRPLQPLWPNMYGIPIKIKNANTGEVIKKDLVIKIKGHPKDVNGNYLPSVRSWVEMPLKIDPRKEFNIVMHLINQNPLNISSLTVIFNSRLIKKTYETSLKALESKDLVYKQKLDPLTKPQKDILNVIVKAKAYNKEYEFRSKSIEYEVTKYGKINVNSYENKSFLKTTKTVIIKNTGNVERNFSYKIKNFLYIKNPFIKTSIKPSLKGEYLVWNGSLKPNEEIKIIIETNYRPLFYLILVIILAILSYYVFRSPIILKKSVKVLSTKDGGLNELRIQIVLKNRTRKRFYNAQLKDKVPNLLEVQHPFEIGTLYPSNLLRSEKKGTIVKWDLEEIDPYEERIFTYKVLAKLVILGNLKLLPAILKYKTHVDKPYKTIASNEVIYKNE